MLTSFFALQQSIDKLSKAMAELKANKLTKNNPDKKRATAAIIGFILALLFFMIELYLLFYVLKYVFVSSPPGPGRNVKIVLLVFFTMPFALLASIVDPRFSSMIDKN